MQENDELRLVLEAIGGNDVSFGRLADSYSPTVLGLVYTYVGDLEAARDITQDALLKAYTSLSGLQRPDRFGSWLRQIAVNLAKSHLRQQSRRPQVSLDDREAAPELPDEGVAAVDQTVERRMARQEILKSLQSVPEGPRAAVIMHYVVGLAPADAARRLGISRAAFDTRLSRGRDALRKEMNQMVDESLTEAREQVAVYLDGIAGRVRSALLEEHRERIVAAKELALLAARANLPRLLRDLRGHDETIRKETARLLGDTLDRRASDALVKALQVEDEPAVQAEICRTLAKIGVTAAVPLLHKLSRNTADMSVHKAATEAAKALQALASETPAADDTDIPVEIDDLKTGGIEDLFLTMLDDASPAVRVQAVDGLGRVESVKAIPRLTTTLQGAPEEYVRRGAAEALGAVAWPGRTSKDKITAAARTKAVQALADALADSAMSVQAEAAGALGLINPDGEAQRRYVFDRFYAAFESMLKRPGPWWGTVPDMLGKLGTDEDQVRIAQAVLRPDVRWTGPLSEALMKMAHPGRTAANPLIAEAIRSGAIDCGHLVEALGRSLDPEALPLLTESVQSTEPRVREAAAKALAGYPEGRTMLHDAIQANIGRADDVVVTAAGALAALGQPADAAYLEAVAERLSPKARISVRAAAKRITRG